MISYRIYRREAGLRRYRAQASDGWNTHNLGRFWTLRGAKRATLRDHWKLLEEEED